MKRINTFILACAGLIMMNLSWAGVSPISINVLDDRGHVLPLYQVAAAGDESRHYLEANDGRGYSLQIRNNTAERIGVVVAVDGRNIISGEVSDLKSNERMYVLNPYQTQVYSGWRTGSNQVNRFYFTNENDSYAAAWDDYTAMGVIATAVYFEQQIQPQYQTRMGAANSKSRAKSAAGTGFGKEEYSPSRIVEFAPERYASHTNLIKYEWHESLCRKGIINCYRQNKRQVRPNRLWGMGYTPYPPGYRHR